jgi:hypothetical protein
MTAPVVEITYFGVRKRLGEIELDLQTRQAAGENAASGYHRAKRDFEKAWATAYLRTEGTVKEREQRTILAIWNSKEYRDLVKAEADFEGWKAVYRTLETRANIGMALLKSMTREAGQVPEQGPQPRFSGARGAA